MDGLMQQEKENGASFSQGTEGFSGPDSRGLGGLPALARAIVPGPLQNHLEVNPLENKYFRHLNTALQVGA